MGRQLLKPLTFAILLLGSGSAWCQDSDGALGSPLPPPTDDPPLKPSHYFAPSIITAGVADTGPALSSVTMKAGAKGAACSVTNPCALPTPARDRVKLPGVG
jgi:hypothetical protein